MTLQDLQSEIGRILHTRPDLAEVPIVNMDCFIYHALNDSISTYMEEDKTINYALEEIL